MKKALIILSLIVIAGSGAWAYGGGGFFQGSLVPYEEWSNTGIVADTAGGYGFGVSRSGARHGGFGIVVREASNETLLGAFGGVISGQQIRFGSLTLSGNLWTGIGYVSSSLVGRAAGVGYFAEATAEAGVKLLPWMQVALYGGLQAMGPLDPESILTEAVYSPVAGMRFAFGGF